MKLKEQMTRRYIICPPRMEHSNCIHRGKIKMAVNVHRISGNVKQQLFSVNTLAIDR